jgi:hypothetical protein
MNASNDPSRRDRDDAETSDWFSLLSLRLMTCLLLSFLFQSRRFFLHAALKATSLLASVFPGVSYSIASRWYAQNAQRHRQLLLSR